MRRLIPVAVLLSGLSSGLLAGCQGGQNAAVAVREGTIELAQPQIALVTRGVSAALKSQSGAEFGTIRAGKLAIGRGSEARQGYAVCGEVSSPASFGDERMVPFVGGFDADLRAFKLVVMGGPADRSAAVLRACEQAGIPL